MFDLDWQKMFVPQESLIELVVRGTVMYFALFLLLRTIIRRHVGGVEMPDLLMIVLIADAAQNGMTGDYQSITGGVVLCGTIILWNYLMDVAACHSKWFSKLVEPPPLPLIIHGKVQRRNLRRENLTDEHLESQMRQLGIEDYSVVKIAYVEPDGHISAIRKDGRGNQKPPGQGKMPGVQ